MIKAKRDGRTVYHWPASLKELIKARDKFLNSGSFKNGPYQRLQVAAEVAASSWQMCACGSLCDAIPRKENAYKYGDFRVNQIKVDVLPYKLAPKDDKLTGLGYEFYNSIASERFEEALKIMNKIEARATVVLRRLGKKKKTYGRPLKIA